MTEHRLSRDFMTHTNSATRLEAIRELVGEDAEALIETGLRLLNENAKAIDLVLWPTDGSDHVTVGSWCVAADEEA